MKLVNGKHSLKFRLGVTVAALLLGQQALAVGTPAGETVENTASVAYEVATVLQTAVPSNTVSFVVDRRVNFTLGFVGTALVPVTPGQTDAFFDLLLTNTSNSALDFELALAQSLGGSVHGGLGTDNVNMADPPAPQYAVNTVLFTGTEADPVQGGPQIVDDLPADAAIRIRVWGDVPAALANGDIAGLDLSATAADPATGTLLVNTTNDDALVDNVFANASGANGSDNAVEVATDGFIVQAATLTVAKSFSIIDGDLGSGLAIPGARIQYEILISNATGAATADGIVISDAIDDDLLFLNNAANTLVNDIVVDDGTTVEGCTADDGDADTDGCSLTADGINLAVGNANRLISIAADGSYTVRFQVQIPDPATTPPASP